VVPTPPTTPDYFALRGDPPIRDYHGPDPGLHMTCAWTYGARGQGIQIADCEYAFHLGTEDLCDINIEPGVTFCPISPQFPESFYDHGTSVLGEMVALDNGYGWTGLVPDATAWFFPETIWVEECEPRRVTAITNAIATVDPGDIVLLEMQTSILDLYDFGPAELEYAVWELTRNATDSDIIVVAAAGNGDQNLDDAECPDGPYCEYQSWGDSGAIIVGAGSADVNHEKLWLSTYGQRVNVQGWGWNVFTLGNVYFLPDQNIELGDDVRQRYTYCFGGTSSTSAFIASAAAALQSLAEAELGYRLTPGDMRQLLIDTGIPQGSGGHIGPFPDLAAAILSLGVGNDCNSNGIPDACEELEPATISEWRSVRYHGGCGVSRATPTPSRPWPQLKRCPSMRIGRGARRWGSPAEPGKEERTCE